jgi:Spy/CpxP family protein refolding chaperone
MTAPTNSAPSSGPGARRARGLAILVLLLAVLAGGLAGIALDRTVLLPRRIGPRPPHAGALGRPREPRMPRDRAMLERRFRERMARELGLTDAQRVRIDSVLDRQNRDVRAIRAEAEPKLDSIRARTRREMDAILTAEQRERMREMGRRGRGRRGGPPGGPPS